MTKGTHWLAAALGLSLMLNALAAGFYIGRSLGGGGSEPLAGPARLEVRILARALPEDRRGELRAALRDRRAAIGAALHDMRRARGDAARLLRAESFDPDALEDAHARLRAATAAVQAELQDVLVDAAAGLTVKERRSLVEALEAHRPPRRR